jgi:hypothetical protein
MLVSIVAILAVLVLVLGVAVIRLRRQLDQTTTSLTWYRSNHLQRQGYIAGVGNYWLQSLDGGKRWFNLQRAADGGLIVTGPADPGLLIQIEGMTALLAHVRLHGPVDPQSSDGRQLLTKAGFTIHEQ